MNLYFISKNGSEMELKIQCKKNPVFTETIKKVLCRVGKMQVEKLGSGRSW